MTENERRIITILSNSPVALSKRELAEQGQMGWATVVKMVDRLTQQGILQIDGDPVLKKKTGRYANQYTLSNTNPTAIGIDIERRTTTVVLTNLKNHVLSQAIYDTPQDFNTKTFNSFIQHTIKHFLKTNVSEKKYLVGIGIGSPMFESPTWFNSMSTFLNEISENLTEKIDIPVTIEGNVRAYTKFLRWTRQPHTEGDLMLVSIRSGVGCGLIMNGELYTGHQGFAGEIGHYKFREGTTHCSCGGVGCLQTLVNQSILCREYESKILHISPTKDSSTTLNTHNELSDLFYKAYEGDARAISIIDKTAAYLGTALSYSILTLNIPTIIISGYFGEYGEVIVEPTKRVIDRLVLPKTDYQLFYHPILEKGFTWGAALLILREFFIS